MAAGPFGGREAPVGAPAGDGLPDQLCDLDDQIASDLSWIAGWVDLAGTDADRVGQPAVRLAAGLVKR